MLDEKLLLVSKYLQHIRVGYFVTKISKVRVMLHYAGQGIENKTSEGVRENQFLMETSWKCIENILFDTI